MSVAARELCAVAPRRRDPRDQGEGGDLLIGEGFHLTSMDSSGISKISSFSPLPPQPPRFLQRNEEFRLTAQVLGF